MDGNYSFETGTMHNKH